MGIFRKGLEKAVGGWSEKVKAQLAEEVGPQLGGETIKAVALANTPVSWKSGAAWGRRSARGSARRRRSPRGKR